MSLDRTVAHFVTHRRRLVVLITALVTIASALVIVFGVRFNSDVLDLFPAHFDSVRVWKISNREFSQGRALTFALHDESGEVDLDEFTRYFGAALRAEPWVVRAMDQLPMGDDKEMLESQALLLPMLLNLPPNEFARVAAALKPEAIHNRIANSMARFKAGSMRDEHFDLELDPLGILGPAFRQLGASGVEDTFSLTSPDNTVHLVLAITNQADLGAHASQDMMRKVDDFRKRVLAGWEGPKPEVLVTGRTAYVGELSVIMRSDVLTTLFISAALVAVVFWFGFRRVGPLVAILHVLLVSCVIAVGVGAAVFHELNMITIGLCAILIGLGVDFGMMLYSIYELERIDGESHEAAVATALRSQGRSVIFGALTSAAGFFSHVFSGCPGFAQLGLLICFGILFASALMMTLFFVLLGKRFRPRENGPLRAGSERFLDWMFAAARRVWVISTFALLLATAFAASPLKALHFNANPQTLEPPESSAGNALRLITSKFPGFGDQLLVLLETGSAQQTHDGWAQLQAAWTKLVEQRQIKSASMLAGSLVLSPTNVDANVALLSSAVDFKAAREALAGVLAETGAQPMSNAESLLKTLAAIAAGDRALLDWRSRLSASSSWWFLVDQFFGSDPNITAGYVRPREKIGSHAQKEQLRKWLADSADGVPYHLSGWSYTLQDLIQWAKGKMVELSAIMIGFNVVLLGILFRRVFPLVVLMTGLALAFGAMLASLKVLGVALNLFNILAFPLVLGIGVDYGIYVVGAMRNGMDLRRSLRSVLKPVLLSGLTTIAGFASLALAKNPALQSLGIVCALGVTWCLISTFFFILPACLSRSAPR
ncbi:MAG TPA: MMPL family transporter [Chthoniobacteraceae bacterium]|jgi:predicted RND superfamily exporter protein|nr:MMPL family transporter [Chthoniobacteraceae bacterium]